MINIKSIINFALIFSVLFIPSQINLFFSNQKNATISTLGFIFALFLYYKYFDEKHFSKLLRKVSSLFKFKISIFISLVFLFIVAFITQAFYLNFETIEWDVASYLVASSELDKGFLPNETQWESKGPIFLYLYNYFVNIVGRNYILFRLLNDFLLFLLSVIIFFTIYESTQKKLFPSFFSSLLFLLLTSQAWSVSEYSELYSLLFMGISYYLFKNKIYKKNILILIGLSFSFSTLINQGTVLFLIPLILGIYDSFRKNNPVRKQGIFIAWFLIPHLFFIILYYFNGLLDIYISTYIEIPLGYTTASYANLYELKVFLRKFYEFNLYLYSAFLLLAIFLLRDVIKKLKSNYKHIFFDFLNMNILFSILFYFIGSHNYYHHLFFLLFNFSQLIPRIKLKKEKILISVLIIFSTLSIVNNFSEKSIENLVSLEKISQDYPLKNLSEEIDSYFKDDFSVLAMDYVLILFYLDKPNYSYIVHPSNHFEDFIVTVLEKKNRIPSNHISAMIDAKPDVIICNQKMIIRGKPTKVDTYNCQVSDYYKEYLELDTEKYLKNENLNYYFDPYKEIKVFIKQDS
jgi:hypothetical protein